MKSLRFAFHQTIPVMFGYLFLGAAYGILLQNAGYHFLWALFTSIFIFAGSMQFVLVEFLTGGISLLSAALTALSVNSRHIFYGISFIEKFRRMGKLRPYMIFSLTDETYSLLCGTSVPADCEEKKVLFSIALLDQCYWVIGSVTGALIGELLPFNTTGIDFSMTALFVVIFVEQWLSAKSHLPAVIGLLCGSICLALLGPDRFLLPALILTAAILIIWKQTFHGKEEIL
ncbi:MAG: AzlC family ABC transporter permease [Clostridiales bacterium]|nr:AzlC family ABC transporter permease [Clostridiales bacterium]